MNFSFSGKKILIISPNYWGKMFVSKHHFANELSKLGNDVVFLNPADLSKQYYEEEKINSNLTVVHFKPIYRGQRFMPSFIFRILVWIQVKFLLWKMKRKLDVIWSFSSSVFNNLNWFGGKIRLYYVADQVLSKDELFTAKSSTLIMANIAFLLDNFIDFNKPCFFINHGLSEEFATIAKQNLLNESIYSLPKDKVRIAFVGNLLKKFIDRKCFMQIIRENPECEFSIYGSYEYDNSNLGSYKSAEVIEFIDFLKISPNVILKGVFESPKLASEIQQYDAFLLVIDAMNDDNKGWNSHKVIEYLSTGNVLISNYMHSYENFRDIIQMVDDYSNEELPELVKITIRNLPYLNRPEIRNKRIRFALENTYLKHISLIEQFVNQTKQNEP